MEKLMFIVPIAALTALVSAFFFYRSMMRSEKGNARMEEIAGYVREGAYAYLYRQYSAVLKVFVVLFIVLFALAMLGIQNPFVPVAFITGGLFSGICGFLGMKTATNASSRTAQGASHSLNRGLKVAFRSGAVMGLVVVGFGLLDIAIWYFFLDKIIYTPENLVKGLKFLGMVFVEQNSTEHMKLSAITTTMLTFGMGASTQALFARVGGGIYTKAADVGADLVGKVEAGIPEDDPRNPATIADNVGDNVGDVAGMGADLYESYVGSILATAALGAALPVTQKFSGVSAVTAPIIIAALGIFFSIAGIFAVRTKENASMKNLLSSINTGIWGSSALILAALAVMAFTGFIPWGIFGAVITGLISGLIIGKSTEYYTSDENKPTKGIAAQTQMGAATTIIEGLAVGMYSSMIPVITIVFGILAAFIFSGGFVSINMGLYGIGFAAVGMLSTLGITLATDAYGPIADNAGGNAEMSGLGQSVRQRTDALDMLGNTTAATGKGFAIGSAALTAMALLSAYLEEIKIWLAKFASMSADGFFPIEKFRFYAREIPHDLVVSLRDQGITAVSAYHATLMDLTSAFNVTLMNPFVISGLFIGGMMAFLFCAMTMKAVGRAAGAMVEEVRRQFREKPGILEGKDKPDYGKCVEISTIGAQKEMVLPSLIAIIVPIITGILFGVGGVLGLLVGGLTTGFSLACMLNNAGGAWDNAKKFIEKGNYNGKGSPNHKAAVVGDTVGDPFKDTSGPSLNILIKLMSMVSVVFAGVIVFVYPKMAELLSLLGK
ncbi:MAG: sodium-translocating pyrophosphatase [Chitinispirillaceae bacterium]|nr:sodium-translocating pyrophosphatase [Chitinispirillaceae bacterium]